MGRQSNDGLGGSTQLESGYQEDATTSPTEVKIEAKTWVWEEVYAIDEDIEFTIDDTIVFSTNIH